MLFKYHKKSVTKMFSMTDQSRFLCYSIKTCTFWLGSTFTVSNVDTYVISLWFTHFSVRSQAAVWFLEGTASKAARKDHCSVGSASCWIWLSEGFSGVSCLLVELLTPKEPCPSICLFYPCHCLEDSSSQYWNLPFFSEFQMLICETETIGNDWSDRSRWVVTSKQWEKRVQTPQSTGVVISADYMPSYTSFIHYAETPQSPFTGHYQAVI